MAVGLYMDHHVHRAITTGLRLRGIDVITAYEDSAHKLADAVLLERATEVDRVLFTQDEDLLVEGAKRQELGMSFSGVIYAHQQYVSIGTCVQDLELIAILYDPEDLMNDVLFLPL